MAKKIENAVIWSNARFGLFLFGLGCMLIGKCLP